VKSALGIPGHGRCSPCAWLPGSAAPSAWQCHRLGWETESRLGALLGWAANEWCCGPGPALVNCQELGWHWGQGCHLMGRLTDTALVLKP